MALTCAHCSKTYKYTASFNKHVLQCLPPDDSSEDHTVLNNACAFEDDFFDDSMLFLNDDQSACSDWSARLSNLFADSETSAVRIIHLNINSVTSKLDEVESLCDSNHFDFIFLQESKLDSSTPDAIVSFGDYHVSRTKKSCTYKLVKLGRHSLHF